MSSDKSYATEQRLNALFANPFFLPLVAVKTSDQSVASSTVMQNDTALVLSPAAGATYIFDCFLEYTAAVGADLKWQWSMPVGASLIYNTLHNEGGGTGLNNSALAYAGGTVVFAAGSGGTAETITMHGTLVTGAPLGTLQLQWAQNTANATATIIKAVSHLMLRQAG